MIVPDAIFPEDYFESNQDLQQLAEMFYVLMFVVRHIQSVPVNFAGAVLNFQLPLAH